MSGRRGNSATPAPVLWRIPDSLPDLLREQEVPKIRDHGGSAVIYTQLTDVEGEMNGLVYL